MHDDEQELWANLRVAIEADHPKMMTPGQIGALRSGERLMGFRTGFLLQCVRYLRRNPRSDASLAVLAWVFAMSDNERGHSYVSLARIARVLDRHPNAITDAVARLASAGCVRAEGNAGGHRPNDGKRKIIWPAIEATFLNVKPVQILDGIAPYKRKVAAESSGSNDRASENTLSPDLEGRPHEPSRSNRSTLYPQPVEPSCHNGSNSPKEDSPGDSPRQRDEDCFERANLFDSGDPGAHVNCTVIIVRYGDGREIRIPKAIIHDTGKRMGISQARAELLAQRVLDSWIADNWHPDRPSEALRRGMAKRAGEPEAIRIVPARVEDLVPPGEGLPITEGSWD
jgi:hypothetical protein